MPGLLPPALGQNQVSTKAGQAQTPLRSPRVSICAASYRPTGRDRALTAVTNDPGWSCFGGDAVNGRHGPRGGDSAAEGPSQAIGGPGGGRKVVFAGGNERDLAWAGGGQSAARALHVDSEASRHGDATG
jgi:hypothetical protein